MTTCHLIAHTNLTLFSHINLGKLHNARRKFVADRDVKLATTQLGINFFRLAEIVHDSVVNHLIFMSVGSPFGQADSVIFFNTLEILGCKFLTLRNDFRA